MSERKSSSPAISVNHTAEERQGNVEGGGEYVFYEITLKKGAIMEKVGQELQLRDALGH